MSRHWAGLVSLTLVLGLLLSDGRGQENILANGEFDAGLTGWYVESGPGCAVRVVQGTNLSGDNALLVDVVNARASDRISFSQDIPDLVRGRIYPVSFIAMAEEPREVTVRMEVNKSDLGSSGSVQFSERVQLTREPRLFTIRYEHVTDTLSDHSGWTARIYWLVRNTGTPMAGSDLNARVWFDQIDFGGEPPSFNPNLARSPVPADGAEDVRRDLVLRWTGGMSAEAHDVYFGTSLEDVTNAGRFSPRGVLARRGSGETSYAVDGLLDLDQTYYWRIDEVLSGEAILKGEVWDFTAEPSAYQIADVIATASHAEAGRGPENTVNGSGLDEADRHSNVSTDMWLATPEAGEMLWIRYEFSRICKLHEMYIWNYNAQSEGSLGYGARDVTIEYSENGDDWVHLTDTELSQASGAPSQSYDAIVAFGGVTARYVRLIVRSGWGGSGSFGLSEVRFLDIPLRARGPLPADGAPDVALDTVLSWRPGREAVSHEVFLGTNEASVFYGAVWAATVADNTYDPGRLDLGTVYYWKVNEVDPSGRVDSWKGDLWSFSTQEYVPIEDFEGYTDDFIAGQTIWQSWIDGYGDAGNGSQVGYATSPFAEQRIVHGGEQSMPLAYDNRSAPYSEASRTWAAAQNWTAGAADTLRLCFYGDPANAAERLYVAVEDNAGRMKVVRHPDSDAVCRIGWQLWTIPFSDLAAAGVNITSVTTLHIGLGDRENPASGGDGLIYIDDIAIGSPVD